MNSDLLKDILLAAIVGTLIGININLADIRQNINTRSSIPNVQQIDLRLDNG